MSLGGIVSAELPGLRAEAESLMQSTVTIRREGVPVRDPATGKMVTPSTTIYTGPARVRFPAGQARNVDQAGQMVAEQSPTVWVPVAVAGIRAGDVGELTANPHAPADNGLKFRVTGVHAQTHSTSRRLPVEVLSHA